MACLATVELTALEIAPEIGTYGPGDVVPDTHILDLSLAIDPALVLIDTDDMGRVFDYDPLVAEIDRLARDGHYATQERLITRITAACAAEPAIRSLDIHLRKRPVLGGTGNLGIRLQVDATTLDRFRTVAN
ncbi:dihydroneopterin aldolase [Dinoroseobacter sp. PD6]|uniref:dihydroneopterin aldolase n=1 Tax=Dinoroseobacter sp. PD6 TaxID=3028384 RepID=UPI00237A6CDB|nr:dihydroneopterin aldolase [Dinoroseobacter sp. PD6]MDD9718810.1 dihydroneopterin aldolase [Dinoroseobacter sp. PD6]